MKNIFTTLLLSIFISLSFAQNCGTGPNGIPTRTATVAGFSPADASLPCAVIGNPVSDTIYFHNYDSVTVSGVTHPMNSLTIDSIYLPAGLCWETNVSNNQFAHHADGVILISGTPTGPPGQYKLRVIANIAYSPNPINPIIIILQNQNLETQYGLRYDLRVTCPSTSCPAINTVDTTDSYIAYTACGSSVSASINPAGNASVCAGDSLTLTANSGTGYTYLWSTGQTSQAIHAAAGSYTVTVYNTSNDSAISAPTTISLSVPDASLTLSGPASFCTGDSVTISAAAGLSYHWSTNANSRSITVGASGNYAVTVTNATPCTASSRSITVSTLALPDTSLTLSGPASFCLGDSLTLTAASGLTYHWSTNAASRSITTGAAGIYRVTVTNATPCSAASRLIIASLLPLPDTALTLSGPLSFCQGDSVKIAATPGLSYHWSNSAATASVTVFSSGTYRVTVTSPNQCTAISRPISVSVGTLPDTAVTASGPTSFCRGDSVILSAAPGLSYHWSTNASSRSIAVNATGLYALTVSNAGCTAVFHGISVVVNDPPVAIVTSIADTLTATIASTYQWYRNGVLLPHDTLRTLVVSTNGIYAVVLTGPTGCSSEISDTVTLPNGISSLSVPMSMRLYPNPGDGIFVLEMPVFTEGVYEVRDQLGRLILEDGISSTQTQLDLRGEGSGIYYLTVKNARQIETIRFVLIK